MGFQNGWRGPDIVSDGLVLYLDAGSPNSYRPDFGTTWKDMSGFNNSGSLINGPTYSSANGGSIVFDGVDDYVVPPNSTFNYSPGTTGEISLEMWIYPTGPYTSYTAEPPTTNLGPFLGQGYFANSAGWGLGVVTASGNNYWVFQVRNFGTIVSSTLISDLIFTNNNWYHIIGTFTRNDFSRLYVNSQLKSSNSSTSLNGVSITPSTSDAAIARGGFLPLYSGCKIPVARIYNRALSASEIQQNYNAQKSRFGL
jgi:hypothetical protein